MTYEQQISLPKTVTSKQRKWIHITVTLSKYKHTKTYRQILERDEMSLWLVPKKKRKEKKRDVTMVSVSAVSVSSRKALRLNRGSLHIIIPPPLLSILLPDNKQREREGE